MPKAIQGLEVIGGAIALGGAAFILASTGVGFAAIPALLAASGALGVSGIAMEAGALADALTSQRGSNIAIRQPAANRQIILGNQRVGPVITYASTTGSHNDQYNRVLVIAGHSCHSILNLFLDGRQVYWDTSSEYNITRNGVNFGGQADGNTHIGPDGADYNFGGRVFAHARFGDQLPGDVLASLTANDGNWSASAQGSPYVGGCTYIYLKIEHDDTMFPSPPEIRLDVNGKDDIYDPRTGEKGFTTNWALLVADRMTDPKLGLGMDYADINEAQLIAAANVCDEEVELAGGGTEARYSAHWHGDTSVGPGDVISTLMSAAAGRISMIGGEWYLWPAYWQGPSFDFDKNILIDSIQWTPYKSLSERFNRVTGTYTAPNYPYNAAGNLYDSNGWYDGTVEDTFQFGYQPTNYPQFAMDPAHGYPIDEWLDFDTGTKGIWAAGTYQAGDIVWFDGSLYKARITNSVQPGDGEADDLNWQSISGNILPKEIGMPCTLSVAQAQRVAKIYLMRNRYEGGGSITASVAAWGMQPTSVMQFTFPEFLGWNQKLLEITGTTLHIEERSDSNGQRGIACWLDFNIAETGADVYEWSTGEELTVYAVPAGLTQTPYVVSPPTNLVLTSTTSTGNNPGIGGNSTNYAIGIRYTDPMDGLVTQIGMQAKPHTDSTWYDGGTISVDSPQAFIYGVNHGEAYDVRIRALRANGAASAWLEVDNFTV